MPGPYQRGICAACGRDVPLKANGKVQNHHPADSLAAKGSPRKYTRACSGTNKAPKEVK